MLKKVKRGSFHSLMEMTAMKPKEKEGKEGRGIWDNESMAAKWQQTAKTGKWGGGRKCFIQTI